MNNKTVTLSRELVEHAMLSCFEAGHGITHDKLRAALAEPVPPAGGEPEVERWDFLEGETHCMPEGEWVSFVDHRAHVTRLQAEVERLNGELLASTNMFTIKRRVNRKLREGLTKARELLDRAPRGVPGFFQWSRDVIAFLAHQSAQAAKLYPTAQITSEVAMASGDHPSAPSAKHEAHCVVLDPEEPGADCTCKHRYMSLADDPRRCADCDAVEVMDTPFAQAHGEPVAFPGYPPVPEDRTLPAPVAVVLPSEACAEDFGDESMANGWNACLDEVARLNQIKQ
jgi:hypothetical protein